MARKPKWRQGLYEPKNPEKYVGKRPIRLKSQWEFTFAGFCDNHAHVKTCAYESFQIPYLHPHKKNPKTGKRLGSIYVPDFLISYEDKHGNNHLELIEIKPKSQTVLTEKSRTKERIEVAVNHAKWKAAVIFCKHKGIQFRVITKEEIYMK